jgi:poly(hydroxyalkanoate) depolymerase family esterase
MAEALRLTRAGRLGEATALIQRLLGRAPASTIQPLAASEPIPGSGQPAATMAVLAPASPVPEAVPEAVPEVEAGGRFLSGAVTAPAGTRAYKLYVPTGYVGQAVPLVVMLHGCGQTADDSAAGTRLNWLAEQECWLVVYPEQAASANPSRCWNWFEAAHQRRGEGEPSLIAGITQQIMASYRVDPRRVYVAGMSAGGAMAAIMAATYPELYAAVGVHSGLASGSAQDLRSALTAMRRGKPRSAADTSAGPRLDVPLIVFHGDRDTTVHPRNGEHVLAQAVRLPASEPDRRVTVSHGQVPGGHAYTRTVYRDAAGQVVAEHWLVHGAGHAWSGGSPAGSFTDLHGPDASRELVRFFREHPKRSTAVVVS